MAAPPTATFAEALAAARRGAHDVAVTRQKHRKLVYCLAEAIRNQVRQALRRATSLTVHTDASQNIFVVRGQMCGADLRPCHALLGIQLLGDRSSALDLATSVVRVLATISTPFFGVNDAGGCAPRQVAPDATLMDHIRSIVEVFNADAASDEQLAGKLLGDSGHVHAFPNLRIVGKDKPHGARRVVSRTWQ
jgi:hypothetical protein